MKETIVITLYTIVDNKKEDIAAIKTSKSPIIYKNKFNKNKLTKGNNNKSINTVDLKESSKLRYDNNIFKKDTVLCFIEDQIIKFTYKN